MIKKSPENVFNFDTSFVDKESLKYKYLIDDKDLAKTRSSTPITATEQIITDDNTITDLIVNKLYDKLVIENKNDKQLQCTNSCKCLVEILPNTTSPQATTYSHLIMNNNNNNNNNDEENNDNEKLKQKILVQDCFCTRNSEKNLSQEETNIELNLQETPEDLLSVENRGYDKTLSYFNGTSIQYNDWSIECETPENVNEVITSIDLLNFAKQIASGMVNFYLIIY